MAAASPEFFKPADAFSPRLHLLAGGAGAEASDDDDYYRCCRTPTGAGISYLGQAATCPPAPRKPRPQPDSSCRKRLFDVEVISLRFDDLDAIFRPSPPPCDDKQQQQRSRRSQGRLAASSGRSSRASLN